MNTNNVTLPNITTPSGYLAYTQLMARLSLWAEHGRTFTSELELIEALHQEALSEEYYRELEYQECEEF